MNSEAEEDLVAQLLRDLGLTITPVSTEQKKTPDFIGTDLSGGRYVIEVKTRHDSDEFRELLSAGEPAEETPSLDRASNVASHLRKAATQIRTYREADSDFSLVCYVAAGFSPEMRRDQIMATLYGITRLNDAENTTFSRPCFFFDQSAFYETPEIDGVLLLVPSARRGGLCPNRYSARRIEHSVLGRRMASMSAIMSIDDLAAQGEILIADPALSTIPERLRDVQRRTGRKLSPMTSVGLQTGIRVHL
jgi:hypothetical protein